MLSGTSMRFATRTFIWSFVPLAFLLAAAFWAVRTAATSAVRGGVQESLRKEQLLLAGEHQRSQRENSRALKVAAENPSLKAGLQLLVSEPQSREAARTTVEDQLSEIAAPLGFDFLVVMDLQGEPVAGIVREANGYRPIEVREFHGLQAGFYSKARDVYQVVSTALHQGPESVGGLAAGELFELSKLPVPAVLIHDGEVVAASVNGLTLGEESRALRTCRPSESCEIQFGEDIYLSLPLDTIDQTSANGFYLRSLQNVSEASAPLLAELRRVFVTTGVAAMFGALLVSFLASRSIVRPLVLLMDRLHESAATGTLPQFEDSPASVHEVRELMQSFNEAASAIHLARRHLVEAYVEFVGSLAHALDARDPYTAGHSERVSAYACATASAMCVPQDEIDVIRIGALLHDVGKIGIPDGVLRKTGPLTQDEEDLIRQHPAIGRRILEGVNGFGPYLPIVELHHENWDGSGYPHGLVGEDAPLAARIVKVADAYDAMTSDRPYRRGMSHEAALGILEAHVGTQLDGVVVAAFASLEPLRFPPSQTADSLNQLANSIKRENAPAGSPVYALRGVAQ